MGKLNAFKERLGQWHQQKLRDQRAEEARDLIRRTGSLENAIRIKSEDTKRVKHPQFIIGLSAAGILGSAAILYATGHGDLVLQVMKFGTLFPR